MMGLLERDDEEGGLFWRGVGRGLDFGRER